MDKESKLYRIAEEQLGYFTSRQAEECGYSRSNFHRKIQSGKWLKESHRGIYRLANIPFSRQEELALWTLWSADKHGKPQGIWSHETALAIHGLSDVSSSKLHMSVPRNFRKYKGIPKDIVLYFVDEIPGEDIEYKPGFRVTTSIRTLKDVIRQGTTQYEQIERAILDLAVQRSLLKGLVTIQEMEKLQEYAETADLKEVIVQAIDSVWMQANQRLAEFGRMIEPYTIGLHLEREGFGSAVCVNINQDIFF